MSTGEVLIYILGDGKWKDIKWEKDVDKDIMINFYTIENFLKKIKKNKCKIHADQIERVV